ncbi:MAG: hypothetical protein ACTSWM_07095, partial [Alphaproteobacteria bacterium]
MDLDLQFAPLLPPLAVWGFGAAFLGISIWLIWRRQRGALIRALVFLFMFLALLDPSLTDVKRDRLPAIVAVVTDNSDSARLADRPDLIRKIRDSLADRLNRLDEFEIRWTSRMPAATDSSNNNLSDGTRLFAGLAQLIADVPPEQVAGAIIITDGQIHDVPASAQVLGFSAPVHVILAGAENERDRRIILHRAPRFGLVGEKQPVTFRVSDSGFENQVPGERVRVTVRRDGEEIGSRTVAIGNNVTIELEVTHAGANVFEL